MRETYRKVAETGDFSNGCSPTTSCCDNSGSDSKAASMELGYSSCDVNQGA